MNNCIGDDGKHTATVTATAATATAVCAGCVSPTPRCSTPASISTTASSPGPTNYDSARDE